MSSRSRYLLFENDERTSLCWWNTLSIATRENLQEHKADKQEDTRIASIISLAWQHTRITKLIERSVIVCETENFSVDKSWLSQQPRDTRLGCKLHFSQMLAAKEKEVIEEALRESQGRVFGPSGAAAKLGLARSTLESKIRH